jgi:hypothetical protein
MRGAAMASSTAPECDAPGTLDALDSGTLAIVYAHLDPRDVVRVSAASKFLSRAADDAVYRGLFARAWDEPAWPVASHKALFLARHRATVAASAVDLAPMIASVESLAALKRGDANAKTSALAILLADEKRWRVVAQHAETLAGAIDASEKIHRTDRTIASANVVRGLHRWLIELTTMAHARRRCVTGDAAWWPSSGNRALLSVARALSACLTRLPSVRESLAHEVAGNVQQRRTDMFADVPEHPPLRELLRLCVAKAPDGGAALGCGGFESVSPFADADANANDDEYGGVEHDHGAVDDATLAAAMGGTPVGTRVWPPAKSLPPRIDQCLALVMAPACLLSAPNTDSPTHETAEISYGNLHLGLFDLVPKPASIPSRGPWPRGGRPPHGQRVRLEKTGAASTVAAMSGAWQGTFFILLFSFWSRLIARTVVRRFWPPDQPRTGVLRVVGLGG